MEFDKWRQELCSNELKLALQRCDAEVHPKVIHSGCAVRVISSADVLGSLGVAGAFDLDGFDVDGNFEPRWRVTIRREISVPIDTLVGSRVEAHSLTSVKELNGLSGDVVGSTSNGRVQVEFEEPHGSKAIKPENLKILEERTFTPEALAVHEDATKRPDWQLPISDAMSLLLPAAKGLVSATKTVEQAASEVLLKWRSMEAQLAAALKATAADREQLLSDEDTRLLITVVVASRWPANDFLGDPVVEFPEAIRLAFSDWEKEEYLKHEEIAQVSSALEAAAATQRLLLTDAAMDTLRKRVAMAIRQGQELEAAVAAALAEWKKQLVRRQVQQTVWDTSSNSTNKVTGVVRFMPFKQGGDRFDYQLLESLFQILPFRELPTFARVSKLWRSVVNDPSWKPELVAFAWGAANVSGLKVSCPKPTLLEFSMAKRIVKLVCSDLSTFALTEDGDVWFWGRSWLPQNDEMNREDCPDCPQPTKLPELKDVVSLATAPAGYFHGRARRNGFGYACAAVTRQGALYTWGNNSCQQLLHGDRVVTRPRRFVTTTDNWNPLTERASAVACGLDYLALQIQRPGDPRTPGSSSTCSVLTCGLFCRARGYRPHNLREWPELRGLQIRQLVAGSFHCCVLTTRGELYTFGDELGQDSANGNLLGRGRPDTADRDGVVLDFGQEVANARPPRLVTVNGLGPVAEISCSTYSNVAVTVDGRVFTWGDNDGCALGHHNNTCHVPTRVQALRSQKVTHAALSYTNGAAATEVGRVFLWGGQAWEGGIANHHGGAGPTGPTEVSWAGVPACYRCSSVALAHRHGFLVFRKQA